VTFEGNNQERFKENIYVNKITSNNIESLYDLYGTHGLRESNLVMRVDPTDGWIEESR
jgi:hypothetical protein